MVSVVSGSGLGLVNTSRGVVGASGELGQGSLGRAGERVTVNAANGNLVVQNQDGLLVGVGADVGLLRTYNSLGGWDGDNGDAWRLGYYRRIGSLTGTLNAAGSTLVRTDADGFESTYTWRDGRYVGTDGAGAYDTLVIDASSATWTDGDTGLSETYAATTGGTWRLTQITDPEGHSVRVAYDAQGLINSLSTWKAGAPSADETLTLAYDGNRRLTQVSTSTRGTDGSLRTQTRVSYLYTDDSAGRLAGVITDLSPEDNSTADGRIYTVTYGYDSAGRLRTLAQTDGSALTIDYDDAGRVRRITDALGHATTFGYDTAARRTSVTDALGQVARLAYDSTGRLGELSGTGFKTSFAYDNDGNLLTSTNGLGQQTVFGHDGRGNLIRSTDASGRVLERSFDAANRQTGETQYAQPGVGQTTRYVYDTSGGLRRLRFSVSAEGRVTEQQYNALGQVGSSIAYTRSAYGGAATLADLTAWASQQAGAQRTDYSYDLRGQLASRSDAAGLTRYTYDPFGRLLQSIDANGNTSAYAYDGLDRLLLSTDALGAVTTTSYDDAGYRTSVLAANGLRTVSTYNLAGLLVAQTQYNGSTALGETRYTYDAANRLRMTQGPTGQRQWMLYDEAGRLVGEVDALGHLSEYRHDAAGRLVQTIGYEQAVNTALLLDAQGQPANVGLATIRPAPSANDRRQWQLFDAAGRLTHQVNGLGEVTETQYDGAGRITTVIQHGQRLAALPSNDSPAGSNDLPVLAYASTGDPDRITRSFYDGDGLQRGTLDAEGSLTEMRYDAAGHLVERIAYATATDPAQRAAGTLSQLLPATTPADRRSVWLYDSLGRQVAEIDPDGWLTETSYNAAGQRSQSLRYARRISGSATQASTLAGLRPAASAEDQRTAWTYDALNRVATETAADGTLTRYSYDNVGNLTSTERAAGTAEARRRTQRHDLQGRLVAELSGEGSAKLAQATTQAQIDAVWSTYATQHAYDAAGRRIRSTDARGSTTVYYYDATGRMAYAILKTERGGEVQASRYNGFGETTTSIRYTRRLSLTDTAALTGGQADAALDAKIAALADSSDQRTQASYNQRGLIQQAIDALGFKTTSSYGAFGQLSRSEAELGDGRVLRTDYSYDRRGLLTATVQDPQALAVQTRTEYDAFGRVTASVDARGYRSTTQYLASDGAPDSGRQVVLTDPTGANSRITYDAFDRVVRQTDALGHSTSFSHDTANRRVTMTTAEGIVTVTESTRQGQVAKVIDGTGAATTYSYDKNGNLLSRTDALGNVTSSSYDAVDNLATQSAAGTLTRYSYDAGNRVLTRQVDPDGLNLRTTYEYDGQGRAVKVTDEAGTITSCRFDAKGELVETVVDDTATGLKLRTTTTYDAQGRTLSVTEGAGTAAARTTEYRYDILGRRVQEIVDPAGLKLTTGYEYDATGNVVLKRDALGASTRYVYDAAGRQRFTIDAEGYLSEQRYDAAGRVTSTLRYDRRFKLSATPTEAELVSATRSLNTQFTSSLEGFEGSAGVWEAGRLKLISQPLPDGNWAGMNSSLTLAAGASFKFELTPNDLQQALHAGVVASGGPYARLVALFGSDGHVRAQTYDATIGTWAYQDLGTYTAGITYSVEITTTDTGGTLTLYPKNAGRAAAYSYTYVTAPDAGWQNVRLFFATQTYPSVPGTTTAYVDNIEERSAGVQATRYVYDAAGHPLYRQDPLGYITKTRYNATGQLIEQTRYATPLPTSTPATQSAFDAALSPDPTYDRPTRHVYDQSGQLRFTIDALGGVTESVYNAHGQVVRTIAYDTPINYTAVTDTSTPATVRALLPASTLAARETLTTYDATGRVLHTAQAQASTATTKLFTVTENQYDAFGRLTRSVAYSTPAALQDLPTIPTAQQLAERLAPLANPAADRSTRYTYDAAGRLVQSTDGEGYTEQFAYDAWGRKTRYTNKNGAVFDYEYDALGRLLAEWSPAVEVTRLDDALTPIADSSTTGLQRIQTRMSYDAWGQLLSRTQAHGRPEARTTRYEYDALGRQVRTLFQPVGVYDAGTDDLASNGVNGTSVVRRDTQRSLVTETVYNAFGQAVASRDVAGNHSYKTYDKLGRLVHEIDANHQVTQHLYSTRDGEYTQVARLGTAAMFADGLGVSSATLEAAVAAAAAASNQAGATRNLRSFLDRLGRTQRVEDLLDAVYSHDSNTGQGGNWVRATTYAYTVWGDLRSKSTLLDRAAGSNRSATTYFAYDLQGGLTRQVDAEGYVTDHDRNAFGEDRRITQYAARLDLASDLATTGPWAAVATTSASANPGSAIGHDRTSVITYDRRGLKRSEQQQDVLLGVVTGGDASNQQAGWRSAHVVTDYQYDGVGNVLSVLGNAYDASSGARLQTTAEQLSFYDALGRLTASVQIGVSALADRTTSFRYDALGHTVLSTRHANLASVTRIAAGGTSPYMRYTLSLPAASADDQVTRQAFDSLGRVLRSRDAMGNDQYFSYDAAGHVAKQWRPFLSNEADAGGQALNAIQVFGYDKLGRQTETRTLLQREAGAAAIWSSDIAQYNAFGEITAKLRDENIADSVAAETYAYYDYDNGGRLWRTNAGTEAGGGVDTVYQYNLQDKVTAVITSPTLDLRNYTSPQAVPTTLAGGVRSTLSTYDLLGRLREQRDLGATHLDGSTTARRVSQAYDAWGNTLAATTSRGYSTHYRYNALNQVIEEKLPTSTYYSDHDTRGDSDPGNDVTGSAVTARPTRSVYIDAWGRNLGSTDARGKTSTSHYTTTGQLEYEYHADGGTVRHVYDNLGRETARYTADWFSGDANSRVYTYSYDRLDQLLTESVNGRILSHANGADDIPGSFTWTWATWTLASYAYDALGHRIRATSGAADKKDGVNTRYWFDTAGRMVKSSTPLATLQYTYNAAGQTLIETDALGQVTRYTYTAGRLATKLDIGGATTQFHYDRSGALLAQANDRGQDLAYSYYDDGRLKTLTDRWADSRSTYDYDVDGNKTVDRFETGAGTASPLKYRDVAMAYDELGRLRSVADTATGTGTLADYELSIQYDANGNRYRVVGSTRDNDSWGTVDEGGGREYDDPDGRDRSKVDLLFAYDAMNRQTGQRSLVGYSGSTEVSTWKFFRYDKDGSRISEEQRFANTGAAGALTGRLVKYAYDFAGRVSEANVISKTSNGSGGDVQGTERQHRKMIYSSSAGFTQEWQWARTTPADSLAYADADPDRVLTTETWVNAGQAITQVVGRAKVGSGAWYLTSNQTQTLDAAGNLVAMHVDGYQAQSTSLASTLDYAYTYLKMDGYRQRTARVSGKQWNSAQLLDVTPVTTTQDYDVNGRLLQVRDDNSTTVTGEQFLVTDNAGHIVMKVQNRTGIAMAAHRATGTYDPATGTHGSAGGSGVPVRPAVPSLAAYVSSGSRVVSSSVQRMHYANEQVMGTTDEVRSKRQSFWYDGNEKFKVYLDTYSTGMRIEDALSAANVNVSAGGALQYTWNSGDTLRGLAQTFYGDASLWYVIAEANGVADDGDIAAGTLVSLPNVTRSSNTASTVKVYDPGKIIGDTNPEPIAPPPPPPPPPPSGGGCGGLGMVLVVVVAVVATVVTAGAAAVAMGAVASGTGVMAAGTAVLTGGLAGATLTATASALTVAAAAAVGGAVGSIASQGVAMATGLSDHFSWKQVGLAALGAGVTSGMGQAGMFGGLARMGEYGQYAAMAANAATGNAITQGLAVATDLQDKFNWRAVATSAIAAPVAQSLGNAAGGFVSGMVGGSAGQMAGEFAQRFTAGVVSQRIRMAVYNKGKLDYAAIAADAFGNALGQGLVDATRPGYSAEEMTGDFQRENNRFAAAAQANAAEAQRSQGFVPELNYDGTRPVYDFGDPFEVGGVEGNLLAANGSATKLIGARPRPEPSRLGAPELASAEAAQQQLESIDEMLRETHGRGPTRAERYRSLAWDSFRDFDNSGQQTLLAAMVNYSEAIAKAAVDLNPFPESRTADVAVRIASDLAHDSGALPENILFGANFRGGIEPPMAMMGSALAKRLEREVPARSVMGPNDGPQLPHTMGPNDGPPLPPALQRARDLYRMAADAESSVTPALQSIAEANGGKMAGLEYRLKTMESLARKVETQPNRVINDALRYTMKFDEPVFTPSVRDTMADLNQQGYELAKVWNQFKEGVPYKGINATYQTPEGQLFELQFHTPASLEMKQGMNHPLYEQQRMLEPFSPEWTRLKEQMIQNSSTVPVPVDAGKINVPRRR